VWIGVISLFPEMFQAITGYGICRRAVEKDLLTIEYWNPRDYTLDRHRTVDDKPYGGGPGMLMKVEPLRAAIGAAKGARPLSNKACPVIYMAPWGKRLDQQLLEEMSGWSQMILLAGRYEGIDERLIELEVDREISIGDFVLSGGEIPAMALIDGVTRLLPGALGDSESAIRESFSEGLLDYPQYTRPETVSGIEVPSVLLSGDHAMIERWRLRQALGRTFERRPDLIKNRHLSEMERELLEEYLEETKSRN